jgi:hypothetical protein
MEQKDYDKIISKRREMVDSKYGAGSYDKAIKKIQPHRCAPHLNEVFYGIRHHLDFSTIGNFIECIMSESGKEPERNYPNHITFLEQVKK